MMFLDSRPSIVIDDCMKQDEKILQIFLKIPLFHIPDIRLKYKIPEPNCKKNSKKHKKFSLRKCSTRNHYDGRLHNNLPSILSSPQTSYLRLLECLSGRSSS